MAVDYAYDDINELKQVTSPSGSGNTMSYAYDWLRLLLTLIDFEGKQTSYAYDFRGRMTGVGATAETSTRSLRDANKSSVGQYEYTPYGLVYGESGVSQIPRKYTGHDPDLTSMLYYPPFRYYNPVVARWTTRDPLGMVDGVNVCAYAEGRPVDYSESVGVRRGTRKECDNIWRTLQNIPRQPEKRPLELERNKCRLPETSRNDWQYPLRATKATGA
jgi:RHS repeat-associated protein